jgi:hypothetical protein
MKTTRARWRTRNWQQTLVDAAADESPAQGLSEAGHRLLADSIDRTPWRCVARLHHAVTLPQRLRRLLESFDGRVRARWLQMIASHHLPIPDRFNDRAPWHLGWVPPVRGAAQIGGHDLGRLWESSERNMKESETQARTRMSSCSLVKTGFIDRVTISIRTVSQSFVR